MSKYCTSDFCCIFGADATLLGLFFIRILQSHSQSYFTIDCLGVEPTLGLAIRYYFLSESCCLVSMGCPLWREEGSAVCSAITQWSESRRTRNHTLLSHFRLPQLGGPGARIYIPQEQGGPVIPPGTGSLYVASYDSQGYVRRRYSNPPPHGWAYCIYSSSRETNVLVTLQCEAKAWRYVIWRERNISCYAHAWLQGLKEAKHSDAAVVASVDVFRRPAANRSGDQADRSAREYFN
jgi:hypothetical protein